MWKSCFRESEEEGMNFVERIESINSALTKKQRKITDYMRNNIETMCFITLKEMSAELGITESTIVNTCKVLGYPSFNEMKYEARKYSNLYMRRGIYQGNGYYHTDISKEDISDKEKLLTEIWLEEKQQMEDYFQCFSARNYLEAAKMFYRYSKVIICGRGASHLLAQRLSSGLALSQRSSRVVNTELNEDVYAMLPAIDKETLLVAIAFPDYYFVTERVAEYGKKVGAKVFVITDNKNTRLAKMADEMLLAPCTTRLSINTLSTPMELITLLNSAIKIEGENSGENDIGVVFGSLFNR